jgi:hypothetical protein
MNFKTRIANAVVAATTVTVMGTSLAFAGTPAHWQNNYRTDFSSAQSCARWGAEVLPGGRYTIPGVDDYRCHRAPNSSTKYAIDLHWRASGGGGGGGSWIVGENQGK